MSTNTRNSQEIDAKTLHSKRKAIRSQRGMKLPYVKPREGYVQLWVRSKLDGTDDDSNIYAKKQEGWVPRKADTLKEGEFIPTTEHGKKGNGHADLVIGTHNMILMERPQAIHDEYEALVRDDRQLQQQAIENDILKFRGEETGRQMSGITSEVHGGSGRVPNIAPD